MGRLEFRYYGKGKSPLFWTGKTRLLETIYHGNTLQDKLRRKSANQGGNIIPGNSALMFSEFKALQFT